MLRSPHHAGLQNSPAGEFDDAAVLGGDGGEIIGAPKQRNAGTASERRYGIKVGAQEATP
ncbi:MAG: hypothetical protein HYX50_03200 [Chloroflexi bacterium]|nr:hypothetical protein [Chloroflexota bacterium]